MCGALSPSGISRGRAHLEGEARGGGSGGGDLGLMGLTLDHSLGSQEGSRLALGCSPNSLWGCSLHSTPLHQSLVEVQEGCLMTEALGYPSMDVSAPPGCSPDAPIQRADLLSGSLPSLPPFTGAWSRPKAATPFVALVSAGSQRSHWDSLWAQFSLSAAFSRKASLTISARVRQLDSVYPQPSPHITAISSLPVTLALDFELFETSFSTVPCGRC